MTKIKIYTSFLKILFLEPLMHEFIKIKTTKFNNVSGLAPCQKLNDPQKFSHLVTNESESVAIIFKKGDGFRHSFFSHNPRAISLLTLTIGGW